MALQATLCALQIYVSRFTAFLLILRLIDDDAAFVVNRKCWTGSDVAVVSAAICGHPL